jgi:hypothetical protein
MKWAIYITFTFNQIHIFVYYLEFMIGCLPMDVRHTYGNMVLVFNLCKQRVDELLCVYISHCLVFKFLDMCGHSFQEV